MSQLTDLFARAVQELVNADNAVSLDLVEIKPGNTLEDYATARTTVWLNAIEQISSIDYEWDAAKKRYILLSDSVPNILKGAEVPQSKINIGAEWRECPQAAITFKNGRTIYVTHKREEINRMIETSRERTREKALADMTNAVAKGVSQGILRLNS